jgi:hypothetical protein
MVKVSMLSSNKHHNMG